MNKLKMFAGVAATVVGLALPVAASASTNLTFLTFPNFGPNVTTEIGSTIQVKDTITLTGSSELESISHQLVDNSGNNIGMPEVCENVADRVVAGTYTVVSDFDLTGGTEGTFGIRTRAYGVTGPGTDNNCGGTVNDNQYYSARVTLTENQNTGNNANNTGGNSTGGTGSGANSVSAQLAALAASIQAFIASLHSTTTPPVTGNAAKCDVVRPYLGAQPFAYSSVGVQLQSALLLDDPTSIPALKAGATIPMGYFGPQTHAALTNFSSKYGCGFIFN